MLTVTQCNSASAVGKIQRLWDQRGLYLEIAVGGGKYWRFKYRIAGREKRISLGVYPDVDLKTARARREQARRAVAAGIDPSHERKATKVAALARATWPGEEIWPVAYQKQLEHLRIQMVRLERERKKWRKEWEKIREGRKLLKEVRALLQKPLHEVSQLQVKA